MRTFTYRDRPVHLSRFPLEDCNHTVMPKPAVLSKPAVSSKLGIDHEPHSEASLEHAFAAYWELFRAEMVGSAVDTPADVPDDPTLRANNLKSSAYFLDAALAGVAAIDATLGSGGPDSCDSAAHTFAFVFAVALPRVPKPGEPGSEWLTGSARSIAELRAGEIAAVMSGYIRRLGFEARGHAPDATQIDLDATAVRAGIAHASRTGRPESPFHPGGVAFAAVTTTYELAPDAPLGKPTLASRLRTEGPRRWFGLGGIEPTGFWATRDLRRPVHMGRFPMEKIARRDTPTTIINGDEIVRIPKRGDFFARALAGDMGARPAKERLRFPFKHPYSAAMRPLIMGMVPLQGVRYPLEPTELGKDCTDPDKNAESIKALGYALGSDMIGICRTEPWMFYSHDTDGEPIEVYHKYAVVMLLDQGHETMEGGSGDDWISASQSSRAYMRGAEIAGVMAAHLQRLGYSARSHSNRHSDVVHNPAILMSGLGEISRIGDTLLNPFIGPRSKSVVLTTDFPMTIDKPIDFGLQDFCDGCNKCARECPTNAIDHGDKIMFNGYEIWKPDVEKCTKYRVTNMKGSACGRCMKMCPWNTEGLLHHRWAMWTSIKVPAVRPHLVKLDDRLGFGNRNPVKKWWFDLEIIDDVATKPKATNERDLDVDKSDTRARTQKVAIYPPALQPPPVTDGPWPVDRKAGQQLRIDAPRPVAVSISPHPSKRGRPSRRKTLTRWLSGTG